MNRTVSLILTTVLFMLGVMMNHLAVNSLYVGDQTVVWIYDLSLIWMIVFFLVAIFMGIEKRTF